MIKRNFIFSLSILFIILLNQVYVNTATTATRDYVPRNIDMDRSPKNILIGSYIGGRSHLKPMLDIAAILIERGHNVILLTSGNYTPSSEYPTVKQFSLGPRPVLKDLSDVLEIHKEMDYKIFAVAIENSLKSYKPSFEKYKNVSKKYNIDLFLCDSIINDACLDAAHTLKKPIVVVGSLSNAIAPVSYKSDPLFGCDSISLENESILERFKCNIMQPLQMAYLLYPVINQLNNIRKQINVEPGTITLRNSAPKISLSLIDSFFGFDLPQSLPPNVQEIGPILSEEYPPLTPELSDFINSHKRVLYVAFGGRFITTTENNSKLLQSFVEAIDKNLIDGVIWALTETSKDSFFSTLNLTDGSRIKTSPILNNQHPHIHITKFVPQFSVLNHTNTKLFLSHAGAGSVHESLYTGIPILSLPLGGDQMGNAKKLKLAGVGLTLNKLNLNVDEIVNKIDFLLKDENVKKNSKRLEVLAKISSKRKYSAADSIEYILYSSSLNEGINNEEFLNEWVPADARMGFIKANNLDIYGVLLSITLGIIGGILWVTLNLIRFIVMRVPSQKSKKD